MDERVKEFLEQKKAELEKAEAETAKVKNEQKAAKLISLGLYEKEYNPNDAYTVEYPFFDSEKKHHYKKVPIQVSDEEYLQILECYDKIDESNRVFKTLIDTSFSIPKSIEDITKVDSSTASVFRYASIVSILGIVLSLLVLIYASILCAEEEILFALPYFGTGLIILAVSDFASKLIGGLAAIMRNTKISASAVLYELNNKK